jgi:hypothetical protein
MDPVAARILIAALVFAIPISEWFAIIPVQLVQQVAPMGVRAEPQLAGLIATKPVPIIFVLLMRMGEVVTLSLHRL